MRTRFEEDDLWAEKVVYVVLKESGWWPEGEIHAWTSVRELDDLEDIELIMAVEEAAECDISDEDIPSIVTVQDLIDVVKRRRGC